jgi:hypothetical protein
MRTVKATPKLNKNEYLQIAGWTRRVLQQVNLAVSVASTALQLGHELPPARRHTHPNTTREPSALLHRVSLPPSLFAFAQAMRSWRVLWSAAASLVRGAVNSWRLTSARATYERNVHTQQKSDRSQPTQKEEERKSATSTRGHGHLPVEPFPLHGTRQRHIHGPPGVFRLCERALRR